MIVGIKDNKSGLLTICCLSKAADLIGVERNALYRMIEKGIDAYKQYTINSNVKLIKLKRRGKMNVLRR